MYVADVDLNGWEKYAEKMTFGVVTAQDRVRRDTPFYLIHGWDPRSTSESALPLGSTTTRDSDPMRWRYNIKRQYQQIKATVNEQLKIAIRDRACRYIADNDPHHINCRTQVWLNFWIKSKTDTPSSSLIRGMGLFEWLIYAEIMRFV